MILLLSTLCSMAQDPVSLAAESEAYCSSTRKDRPTQPRVIIEKVYAAAKLLEAEGPEAFPKFKGKDSEFIYEGTYIWIHTLEEARMLMHPIKFKMEGKDLIGLKDKKGKRFFVVMNNLAREKGEGWVEYYWPVPGTSDIVRKVSFVRKCTMANGVDVVIGSGIYNGAEDEMAKLDIK